MTQMRESRGDSRGVDADVIDSSRRVWVGALLALIAGLILGSLAGGLYGHSKAVSHQAVAELSVLPDSSIDTQLQTSQPTLDATSYIQSELVVLNGNQLATKVQDRLHLAKKPDVTSTQVGQTYVVEVTATASSAKGAQAIASALSSVYSSQRASELTAQIKVALTSTAARLKAVQNGLAAAQAKATANAAATPAETALQTEYERLLAQSSGLSLSLSQVSGVVTVVAPAHDVSVTLSTADKALLGGALVGAVLGLVLFIAIRRAVPRIRSVGDLNGLGLPVLLPVLPRRKRRAGRGSTAWRSSQARLLSARLMTADPARVLVIVGPTSGVGTSYVATALAAALADQGPVLLVRAADPLTTATHIDKSSAATDSVPGSATQTGTLVDVTRRLVPSTISGVWVLPDGLDLVQSLPGMPATPARRSKVLVDVLRRASAAGWLVVVDAPPLSESGVATDCLALGGIAALVVGRGVSKHVDVLSAAALFEAHSSGLSGAILNDIPRGIGRIFANRRAKPIEVSDASAQRGSDAVPTDPDAPDTDAGQSTRRRDKRPSPAVDVDQRPADASPAEESYADESFAESTTETIPIPLPSDIRN